MMRNIQRFVYVSTFCLASLVLSSCSSMQGNNTRGYANEEYSPPANYSDRLPSHLATREKTIVVDPHVHAWGAYENGELLRAGLATAGSDYCPDLGRRCHTSVGTFRIYSLGSPNCKSSIFPIPRGGAPMPYCMFFNKNQALHGVPEGEVAEANLSHGCVRLHVPDAEWIRYNFATIGTKVIVKPY